MLREQILGDVDDHYDLEALAGAGGMGAVYPARDRRTGEVVALERIRGDSTLLDRVRREIRLLADLDHRPQARGIIERQMSR